MNLTVNPAAQACGISKQAFLKAQKTGKIKPCGVDEKGHKLYDVEQCKKDLLEKSNTGKQANARAQQRTTTPTADSPQPTPVATSARSVEDEDSLGEEPPEEDDGSYNEACRQEKWESVRKKRLERHRLEGELVEVAQVRQAWSEMVAHARSQSLLLPAKLAPKVAMLTDARDVQMLLDREIRALLTALTEYQPANE